VLPDNIIPLLRLPLYAFYVFLFVRVIASWVRISPYHRTWGPILGLATRITDPLLGPIRRLLNPYQRSSGIDFSPVILYMLLEAAFRLLENTLRG
jgi:uncharacterized protein YggT (Ycf19 family)